MHTDRLKKNKCELFFVCFFNWKAVFCVCLRVCLARFPLPVPPARQGHAGRPCAPAASLLGLWQRTGRLPRDLPPRQHPAGAAALHPHRPAGNLVLGGERDQQVALNPPQRPSPPADSKCSPPLRRSVSCSTLLMGQSGTSAITAIWCSSPCVTPGIWPSPCSWWASCTVSSPGKISFVDPRLISTEKKVDISAFFGLVFCSLVRTRLKRTPPMEMGLLKPRERDPESEDETLWGDSVGDPHTPIQGKKMFCFVFFAVVWRSRPPEGDKDMVPEHFMCLYLRLIQLTRTSVKPYLPFNFHILDHICFLFLFLMFVCFVLRNGFAAVPEISVQDWKCAFSFSFVFMLFALLAFFPLDFVSSLSHNYDHEYVFLNVCVYMHYNHMNNKPWLP